MEGALTQAEAAEDMKLSTKKLNEMATWETEMASSSEKLREMEAWEIELVNMDPDVKTWHATGSDARHDE